jgi:hypothetical protein
MRKISSTVAAAAHLGHACTREPNLRRGTLVPAGPHASAG